MAKTIKPTNFPLRPVLNGQEEIYTQTGGVNEKFLVDQVVQRAQAVSISPLEFTFTNTMSYSDAHNLGRAPFIRVVQVDGSDEVDITFGVEIRQTTTNFTILSNTPISGKVYVI